MRVFGILLLALKQLMLVTHPATFSDVEGMDDKVSARWPCEFALAFAFATLLLAMSAKPKQAKFASLPLSAGYARPESSKHESVERGRQISGAQCKRML